MLKYLLTLIVVAMFGANLASAQQMPPLTPADCDPYQIGQSDFSIDMGALVAAPQTAVEAAAIDHMGINPQALMQLADNVSAVERQTAEFANPDAQLIPNTFAFVTEAAASLTLYAGACLESPVLAQLEAGTRVTVLDGPIAAEGFAWWRVRRSDLTGWVIEGQGDEIWLQG